MTAEDGERGAAVTCDGRLFYSNRKRSVADGGQTSTMGLSKRDP